MLIWIGVILIFGGLLCLTIDRRAVHFIYDAVPGSLHRLLNRITHGAKAAHWIAAAAVTYGAAHLWLERQDGPGWVLLAQNYAWAFLVAIAGASAVLHTLKLFLGRRRPRDEIEMNLYAFMPLSFDLQHNSFPSGHALTIFCVATIASAAFPALTVLWFAGAVVLAFTRALLTAHFVSDVLIGAGIGLIAGRVALVYLHPELTPGWF